MTKFVFVIYSSLKQKCAAGKKQVAWLIDPDKVDDKKILELVNIANQTHVNFILVGGSTMITDKFDDLVLSVKLMAEMPVILFPGSLLQLSKHADAIFLLSLISGRNPDLLIGQHVLAANKIRSLKLESIPVGYMLIDGGNSTAVSYMSNSQPIPSHGIEIALSTALAGEMLGLDMIFLDAGSGAKNCVSTSMISSLKKHLNIPLTVGGGIRTVEKAIGILKAGADIIVLGNVIENDSLMINEMMTAVNELNYATNSHLQFK